MALNIKNRDVERLASEVSHLTGESKTEAIKIALSERKQRILGQSERARSVADLFDWLGSEVWPTLPKDWQGGVSKVERERILGLGPEGF